MAYVRQVVPKLGQRVRVIGGTTVRWQDGTFGLVNAQCYADVIAINSYNEFLCALLIPHEAARRAYVPLKDIQIIKGKPFVAGHDEHRRCKNPQGVANGAAPVMGEPPKVDTSADDSTSDSTSTTTTPEAPVTPAPAVVADKTAAANAILELLNGGGLNADEVRAIAEDVTAARVSAVTDSIDTVATRLQDFLDAFDAAPPAVKARTIRAIAPASTNPMADALAKHYTCGEPVRGYPLVLLSGPSLGKTYNVSAFAKTNGYDVLLHHGCSRDMDEIATLVGAALPDTEKGTGFALPDGVATQAWRAAAAGKNVLFLLDEIFRLSETTQEWLLTALQPDKDGYLTLRTRRIVDGALEVIKAHTSRLHIVGAANLTERTDVVEAFWSRWTKRRFEFTADVVKEVARHILAQNGVTDTDDTLATAYGRVVQSSRAAFVAGTIRYPLDIRVLESAAAVCNGTAASCRDELCELLVAHSANWDDIANTDSKSIESAKEWEAALRRLSL